MVCFGLIDVILQDIPHPYISALHPLDPSPSQPRYLHYQAVPLQPSNYREGFMPCCHNGYCWNEDGVKPANERCDRVRDFVSVRIGL